VLLEPCELTKEEEKKMKAQKQKTFNQTLQLGDVLGGTRVQKLYSMIANQFTVSKRYGIEVEEILKKRCNVFTCVEINWLL
jgi:hypothetical protein